MRTSRFVFLQNGGLSFAATGWDRQWIVVNIRNMPGTSENIETVYQRRIDAMTPAQRVARGVAMFQMTSEAIARRIVDSHGPMPPEPLKWHVAMQLYGHENAELRELIQSQIDHVSG